MDIQDGWLTTARQGDFTASRYPAGTGDSPFTGDPQYQSAAGTVRWSVY